MYSDKETKWFSQTLLTFKDKQFNTDGFLRLAISTNSEDYKFFNPPIFNISISTNIQKSYNLNIQNAEDLLESFDQALKQSNGNEIIIEKKYQKTAKIYFRFAIENVNQTRVVVVEIISNESDATKIIIPLKPTFQSFLRRLRYYVQNYDQICLSLLGQSINYESSQIIQQLPSLIKGISSQIISQIPEQELEQDSGAPEIKPEEVKETTASIEDLDKFLGDDMENINIPEIDKNKAEEGTPIVEIQSDIVEKILSDDLTNLESKLTSFGVSKQPVLDLIEDLETSLGFSLIPGINEDDKKSLVYLSTLSQNYYSKSYTINDTAIPSSTPILKYKSSADDKNVELAKDLLTIIGYFRTVRRRMESKIQNAYDNKSMVYLFLRCFMDPICFSFIDHLSKNELVSSIKNRYMYFNKNGFFDRYIQLLKDNNCPEISVRDITDFAEEVSDKIVGKTLNIDELHQKSYENEEVKLPSKNTFSLEQIINEFIPLEINYKMGFNFKDKELVKKFKENNKISDEILNFFIKKQKVEKTTQIEKITPLQRWVDKYKQDIPDGYRDSFIKHIKELKYEKFNFEKNTYPLDEFDDRIVKALYVWDPESDSNIKTNFNHFATLVEDEQMTKESILVTTKEEKDSKSVSDWDQIDL